MLVKNISSFSVNIAAEGYDGLIGLGPNTGSVIRDKVGDSRGDSVLDRIFQQNTSSSNYMSVLLNRLGDPTSPAQGQMSISEIIPGYENITNMAKLTVEKVHKLTDLDQHWQVYTDKNGVIGPDGQPIEVDSIVPSAPDGQLVVVFDSGYTLPQVPRAMSDAIYGRVQGAEYNSEVGVWTIPCTQMLNISFQFGGVNYPISPLDTSSSEFDMINAAGETVCVGAVSAWMNGRDGCAEPLCSSNRSALRSACSVNMTSSWACPSVSHFLILGALCSAQMASTSPERVCPV